MLAMQMSLQGYHLIFFQTEVSKDSGKLTCHGWPNPCSPQLHPPAAQNKKLWIQKKEAHSNILLHPYYFKIAFFKGHHFLL